MDHFGGQDRPCAHWRIQERETHSLDLQWSEVCSCSSWNARNAGALQPGDPLVSDETGSACVSQNSLFDLSYTLSS